MTQLMRQQAEFRINQIPLFGFPFSVPFQYNEFNRPFNLNNLPQNNQYFHQFKQFQPPAH